MTHQMEADLFTVERFTLDNGLRVWCKPRPGTGTVALLLQVRVGTRYETKANNGISHFLEHMVFTGSERWTEEEIKEAIRRRGGSWNGTADYEDTTYEVHLRAADLAFGLDWLAEVVFRPTLPPEMVDRERSVIIEEKGGRLSRWLVWLDDLGFGYDLGRAVRRGMFPGSALGLYVIGEDSSLAHIGRKELLAHHRRTYLPNNMTLIVVGDVTPQAVQREVQTFFGGFAPGPLPPRPATPPQVGRPLRIRLRGPEITDRAGLLMGGRTGGLADPDRFAQEVLAEVLEHALIEDLRYRQALVYDISAEIVAYTDVGLFTIATTCDGGSLNRVRLSINRHIRRICEGELSEAALAEARAALRGRALLGLESNLELAWWLASEALHERPDAPVPNYFAELDRVTRDDVIRAARTVFRPETRFEAVHRPFITVARGVRLLAAGLGLAAATLALRRHVGLRSY
jgi:predicted Zn-dependent peptidase